MYSVNIVYLYIANSTYLTVYLTPFYILFFFFFDIRFFTYWTNILYIFASYMLHFTLERNANAKGKAHRYPPAHVGMSGHHRRLVPGPSPEEEEHDHDNYHENDLENGSPLTEEGKGSGTWKKRVSTACLACKKSKRKVRYMIHYSTLHLHIWI